MLGALITHVRYLSNRDDIIVVRRILSLLGPWSSYFGHSNLIIASQGKGMYWSNEDEQQIPQLTCIDMY